MSSETPRTDAEAWRYQDCNGDDSVVPAAFARTLETEIQALTIGRCTCVGCHKVVNNAWRDQDGQWCLTCLAKQRNRALSDAQQPPLNSS